MTTMQTKTVTVQLRDRQVAITIRKKKRASGQPEYQLSAFKRNVGTIYQHREGTAKLEMLIGGSWYTFFAPATNVAFEEACLRIQHHHLSAFVR